MKKNLLIWVIGLIVLSSFVSAYEPACSTTLTDYEAVDTFDDTDQGIDTHTGELSTTWIRSATWEIVSNEASDSAQSSYAAYVIGDITSGNHTFVMWSKTGSADGAIGWTISDGNYNQNSYSQCIWNNLENTNIVHAHGASWIDSGEDFTTNVYNRYEITLDATNSKCYYRLYDTENNLLYQSGPSAYKNAGTPDRLVIFTTGAGSGRAHERDNFTYYTGDTCPISIAPKPTITLTAPADNNITNTDINFTFDVSVLDTDTCTLYGDWSGTWEANSTITSTPIGSYDFGKIGVGNEAGTYLWGVMCELDSVEYWSTNRTLVVDLAEPAITLNTTYSDYSADNYSSPHGNPYNDTIRYWYDVVDDRDIFAYAVNVTSGATNKYSMGGTTTGTHIALNEVLDVSSWSDGYYKIVVEASDSHTKNKIKDYSVAKSNKKLTFNTEEGNLINIESDDNAVTDAIKDKDRYSFNFDFIDKKTKNRVFHITSDKPIIYRVNSNYQAHFIVLGDGVGGNWIDFEGVNSPYTVEKVNDYHYKVKFDYVPNKVKFNSIGGLNTNTVTHYFYVGKYSTYSPISLSGETAQLYTNITGSSIGLGTGIVANLTYNGTLYVYDDNTLTTTGTNFNQQLFRTITNPTTSSLYDYYWDIQVPQLDGTKIEFTTPIEYQNVTTWGLGSCDDGGTPVFYFNISNEENIGQGLTSVADVDIQYWATSKDNYKTYNAKLSGSSNYSLCFTGGFTSGYADIYISHTTTTGFTHRYYAYNEELSTSTLKREQLFNFNTTELTGDLELTTRKVSDYSYYSNIVARLERFYPSEDLWREVQDDLSGDFGLIFFNIREEDTDYRIKFYDTDNNLLKTTDKLKFACASGICQYTTLLSPADTTGASGVFASWSYDNSTKLVTIVWEAPSTAQMSIKVQKLLTSGTTDLCDFYEESTGNTTICDLSGYSGVVDLIVNSTYNGVKTYHYGTFIDLGLSKIWEVIERKEGAFWGFIVALVIIPLGLISPVATILMTLFALISLYLLGFIGALQIGGLLVVATISIALGLKFKS